MENGEWFGLVVYTMATWRVASLLVNEAGPWGVFQWLRERAGIEHDFSGEKTIIPDRFLAGLFSCVWCASLWAAAGWMIFDWFLPLLAVRVALVFALSAGAIWFQKRVE